MNELMQRREEILKELEWRNVITDSYIRLETELRGINREIDRRSRSLQAHNTAVKPP